MNKYIFYTPNHITVQYERTHNHPRKLIVMPSLDSNFFLQIELTLLEARKHSNSEISEQARQMILEGQL